MTHERVPVIIAGAGPVGLLLANLLGQQGIECLLVDKRLDQPDWSRAIGLTPPSLALFRQTGLLSAFLAHGVRVEHCRVFDEQIEIGSLNFDGLNTDFPFILSLPQCNTMTILAEGLMHLSSVTYCPGIELKGLIQTGDGVQVLLAYPGGRGTFGLMADWLIGCDGRSSAVRSAAGIGTRYASYHTGFVMADYEDRTGWGPEARIFFTAHGSLESFPLPKGLRRWIALKNGGTAGRALLEERARRLAGISLAGLARSPDTAFIPERLLADTFWRDRVILAGDAAHVMSPIGGQGMNLGFGDTALLSILMPALLAEPAKAAPLLADYDRTRKRAFRIACAKAAAGQWLGTRTGEQVSALRTLFVRWALHSPAVADRLSRHFAMLRDMPVVAAS